MVPHCSDLRVASEVDLGQQGRNDGKAGDHGAGEATRGARAPSNRAPRSKRRGGSRVIEGDRGRSREIEGDREGERGRSREIEGDRGR